MSIKVQIENELKRYLDAFNEKRWNDFSNCLDGNFKYFTDNCTVQDKEQFISFLTKNKWEGKGYSIFDLEIISSADDSTAIARYQIEFTGTHNTKPEKVYAIETTCFSLINGEWKIVHSHTSNKV